MNPYSSISTNSSNYNFVLTSTVHPVLVKSGLKPFSALCSISNVSAFVINHVPKILVPKPGFPSLISNKFTVKAPDSRLVSSNVSLLHVNENDTSKQKPIDCVLGSWIDSSRCNVSCGGGTKTQTLQILTPASNGGTCPSLSTRSVSCNTDSCPETCVIGEWVDIRPCTAECGGGFKLQTKPILMPSKAGGNCPPEPIRTQLIECNTEPCTKDCVIGKVWMDDSQCSVPCGGGIKKQILPIIIQAQGDGKSCPPKSQLTQDVLCNNQPCPIDCVAGPWIDDPNNPCDVPCGEGHKTLTRSVLTQPAYGGTECPTLTQIIPCKQPPCPINCVVGGWSDDTTSPCNVTCGTGTKRQVRNVLIPPAYNGSECPALTQNVPCTQPPCPVDCVVGPWKDDITELCNVTCGIGTKGQLRDVFTQPAYGGKACPTLTQTSICIQPPCPIDCVVDAWRDDITQPCNVTCGDGFKGQVRDVMIPSAYKGKECPLLTQSVSCTQPPCPVDCVVGTWKDDLTKPCDVACGLGMKGQFRDILTPPAYKGKECPVLTQTVSCIQPPCPIDCVVGPWKDDLTKPCDVVCGVGSKGQTRDVLIQPAYKGKECPVLTQTVPCTQPPCPINCVVGSWRDDITQPCNVTCGVGSKYQIRDVVTPSAFNGTECPTLTQIIPCIKPACPINCVVGAWKDDISRPCNVPCGIGSKGQVREIVTPMANNGTECPALTQSVPCTQTPCPIHCEVGSWRDDPTQQCNVTCGTGNKGQIRDVLIQPAYRGNECPPLTQIVPCIKPACPINCVVGAWKDDISRPCNVPCGTGSKGQVREIVTPMANNGTECPALTQSVPCTQNPCPIHCEVGSWRDDPTQPCNVTCGTGNKVQIRDVLIQPAYQGNSCPALTQIVPCIKPACPVDCIVGLWRDDPTQPCNVTCGTGTKGQIRDKVIESAYGGKGCDILVQTVPCMKPPCPVNCVVGVWRDDPAQPCNVTCGTGTKGQIRDKVIEPAYGGKECDPLVQTVPCTQTPCPINCLVGLWRDDPTQPCNVTCGAGTKGQIRDKVIEAAYGGKECDPLVQTVPCMQPPCPVNCVMSAWSDWGPCSKTCGQGIQTHTRSIVTDVSYGGSTCPPSIEQRSCLVKECPINCVLSDWIPGPCSATCGGGTQTLTKQIAIPMQYDGVPCTTDPSLLSKTQSCNTQSCLSSRSADSLLETVSYVTDTRTYTNKLSFKKVGTFTFAFSAPMLCKILVVAGGGAGGNSLVCVISGGDGGGGGGVLEGQLTLTAGTYTVTVGDGGSGTNYGLGNNGNDSSISYSVTTVLSETAKGGGGGGGGSDTDSKHVFDGAAGGSGGGSGFRPAECGSGYSLPARVGGASLKCSNCTNLLTFHGSVGKSGGGGSSGGGGGASGNISSGLSSDGTGGYIWSDGVGYGGGGGGGSAWNNNTRGQNDSAGYGTEGGGSGGMGNTGAVAGTANTGGGGGGSSGGGGSGTYGNRGGSGIVIILF